MIKQIVEFIEEGVSLNFSFSKKGEKIIVMLWPVIHGLEKSNIQPISIAGTEAEITAQLETEAFKALMNNKVSLTNIKTFEDSIKKLEEEKKTKAAGKKTTGKKPVEKKDEPTLKINMADDTGNIVHEKLEKEINKSVKKVEEKKPKAKIETGAKQSASLDDSLDDSLEDSPEPTQTKQLLDPGIDKDDEEESEQESEQESQEDEQQPVKEEFKSWLT